MIPEVEQVFRREYGRAVAILVRLMGDIGLAEEGHRTGPLAETWRLA